MISLSDIPESRQAKAKRWIEIVSEQNDSGLPIKGYCKKVGVNPSTFYYWSSYLKGKISAPNSNIQRARPSKKTVSRRNSKELIAIKVGRQYNPSGSVEKEQILCSLHLRNGSFLKVYDLKILSILLKELA